MRMFAFVFLLIGCNPTDPELLLLGDDPEPTPDFVPALQPFVNEGCNTSWANASAIVGDGIIYFEDLPDWTPDENDYDKSRFTFIFQARNPWYGVFEGENPYTYLQTGWYTLPIDDYGSLTCEGVQEVRIWVLDERTGNWYMNSQNCWAAVLCNGQTECTQGLTFDQIEYADYTSGYHYLHEGPITEY